MVLVLQLRKGAEGCFFCSSSRGGTAKQSRLGEGGISSLRNYVVVQPSTELRSRVLHQPRVAFRLFRFINVIILRRPG